jgi:cysteine synthase A
MKTIEQLKKEVGHTPLVELTKYSEKYAKGNKILAKVESKNPTGSVKDRPVVYMIASGYDRKLIKPDTVIIEPTSGNTGIAVAYSAQQLGLKSILVMPSSMTVERREKIASYGASLDLTDPAKGMQGTLDRVEELKKEYPNHFVPSQFANKANVVAHYETTAPEIYSQAKKVDVFIAGIGTGGTVTGVGKYAKDNKKGTKIIGVEPEESPLLTKGTAGKHGIQGIGANFVPEILDRSVIDEIITVKSDVAKQTAIEVNQLDHQYIGISAGAAVAAAVKYIEENKLSGKTIVVILPDGGEKYISLGLVNE